MATPDAELNSRRELAPALEKCLNAIDSGGSFCTHRPSNQLNPGLQVEGVDGIIGMPVSRQDVQRIIELSRQAPFGKDSETIVDKTVRNTWEIDASRIKLHHSDWPSAQQKLLNQVCNELGVPEGSSNVRAELYKLLIYEEGAMFKPHQDTEKAEGMFATMVISLPCEHEGGDVVVSFKGQRKILQTSPNSNWYCACLAWYSDVVHEVKPVTAGYRMVLTYNLIQTASESVPCAQEALAQLEDLRGLLHRWRSALQMETAKSNRAQEPEDEVPERLVYLLEHKYTQAGLRKDQLKGWDRPMVQVLSSLEAEGECVCYLANLEEWRTGDTGEREDGYWWSSHKPGNEGYDSDEEKGFHPIVELVEETLDVKYLATLDGKPSTTRISLDSCDIVHEDVWENLDPDEQEWSGYTGNEGVTSDHWSRVSAVIIMPINDDKSVDGGALAVEGKAKDPAATEQPVVGAKRPLDAIGNEENIDPLYSQLKRPSITPGTLLL